MKSLDGRLGIWHRYLLRELSTIPGRRAQLIVSTSATQHRYLILLWSRGRLHLCLRCQQKTSPILPRSGMKYAMLVFVYRGESFTDQSMYLPSFFQVVRDEKEAPRF